MTLVPPKYIT